MQKEEKSLAGLRVRHRVVDLLHRAPRRETALPSAAELARNCNVSMSTVNRELKKMVEDGLIVGKRGIGMFTVPGALAFNDTVPGRRIVGIIYGDGRFLYYGTMEWNFIFRCGFALLPGTAHPSNITLVSGHPDDLVAEIRALNLDGVIAVNPHENLQKALRVLGDGGLPVIALGNRIKGIPAILIDNVQAGEEMGLLMLKHGIRSVLWMSFDPVCREQLAGVRRSYAKSHCGLKVTEAVNVGEVEALLDEYAENGGMPEAVYIHGEAAYSFRRMWESRQIDGSDCFLLIEGGIVPRDSEFRGIVRDYPYREMAEQAAACLEAMFAGKAVKPEYLFQFQVSE